jgi:hypothetical protein
MKMAKLPSSSVLMPSVFSLYNLLLLIIIYYGGFAFIYLIWWNNYASV